MKIVRFKDYSMLENIKIEILNSKKLRVNDVIMEIENLYGKALELIKQIGSEKVQ